LYFNIFIEANPVKNLMKTYVNKAGLSTSYFNKTVRDYERNDVLQNLSIFVYYFKLKANPYYA